MIDRIGGAYSSAKSNFRFKNHWRVDEGKASVYNLNIQ